MIQPDRHHATSAAPWPPTDLEHLNCCPLCGDESRRVLHSAMPDRLYASTSSLWDLMACTRCGSAYLDPRPDAGSIGRAYARYFTHDTSAATIDPEQPGADGTTPRLHRWLKACLNGYRNARWGTRLAPAHPLGRWYVPLAWPMRSLIVTQMRHMPRRSAKDSNRLLDVGCGNGTFLELARSAGWAVQGVDFDPLAVAAARQRGLDVRHGSIEDLGVAEGGYDWITCSHVLEHVHDPRRLLKGIADRLRPGGTLWLQTPNLDSVGHAVFGRDWRDLDPPRHLVVLTPKTLAHAFRAVGLVPEFRRLPAIAAMSVYASSSALRDGRAQEQTLRWNHLLHLRHLALSLWQATVCSRAEFITVTARKPPLKNDRSGVWDR